MLFLFLSLGKIDYFKSGAVSLPHFLCLNVSWFFLYELSYSCFIYFLTETFHNCDSWDSILLLQLCKFKNITFRCFYYKTKDIWCKFQFLLSSVNSNIFIIYIDCTEMNSFVHSLSLYDLHPCPYVQKNSWGKRYHNEYKSILFGTSWHAASVQMSFFLFIINLFNWFVIVSFICIFICF